MTPAGLIATEADLDDRQRETLREVVRQKKLAEDAAKPYRDRWNRWYGLYRNYRRTASTFAAAGSENDRDEVRHEARREWGAELFIPYCFATVETVVPKVLLNDPKMVAKPKRPGIDRVRLDAVRQLFEDRQRTINYNLKLQPTARRGLKFGLGVQKTFWNRKTRNRIRLERGIFGGLRQRAETAVVDEGPMAEDIDIFDFLWDPVARDIETCSYVIHRTWRNLRYIRERVEQGDWFETLDLDAVERMGSETARGELWQERMRAAGIEDYPTRQGRLHEVWEYHDGEQVHTVLDGSLLVQSQPSPFHHRDLPFQIFRPTIQEGEFVGIGEIEPIEHLQAELNTMRSQRRDNATLVLQKAFMYAEGLVDPADLVVGPGVGIPVLGNPGEVIEAIQFGDIPASGYQEELALKNDIELTSGISDPVAGGSGASGPEGLETATGIQLIQAAANTRISMKTKLLEWETIKPAAEQWHGLWRQHMRAPVAVRAQNPDAAEGDEFIEVGRPDIEADIEIQPDAGTTQPENTVQKRNDAMTLHNQFSGNPVVDPRRLALHVLEQFDVPDPEGWLVQEQGVEGLIAEAIQAAPSEVGEVLKLALVRAGMPEENAEQAVMLAVRASLDKAAGEAGTVQNAQANGAPVAPGAEAEEG